MVETAVLSQEISQRMSRASPDSSSDALTSRAISDLTIWRSACLRRRQEPPRGIHSLPFRLLHLRWTFLMAVWLLSRHADTDVYVYRYSPVVLVVSASATTGTTTTRRGWLSNTRDRFQPSSYFFPIRITENPLSPASSSSSPWLFPPSSESKYKRRRGNHSRKLHQTRNDNANNNANDIKTSLASVKNRVPTSTQPTTGAALRRTDSASQRGAATSSSTATDTATGTNPLVFWENMVCGATSRSMAQTIMHPANTMKTILQNARGPTATTIGALIRPSNFRRLTVGAGANFLLSMPHGAVNFAVLELVRSRLSAFVKSVPILAANEERFSFGLDFLSSTISTVTCSIVSTPQMMITDNIMAGNYPNLMAAVTGLASSRGVMGFYSGWWPGLVGKIPSYAFTWTFFQQLKHMRNRVTKSRPATDLENSAMGCLASAITVCLMIPMDTIKTRLVSQAGRAATADSYTGILNCAVRIFREEGVATFYRGLPPRLVSVVPMIGIQFGVYEFMKRVMLQRRRDTDAAARSTKPRRKTTNSSHSLDGQRISTTPLVLEGAMMEVAASPDNPFPAPQFTMRDETKRSAEKAPKR